MENAVICGYVRSPFTPANKGALAMVRPDEMLGMVISGLLARTGIKPELVEDVIAGCAFPEGEQGFNVGRIAAFIAGLPDSVAGCTLNRFCGSSMQSIHNAAGMIAIGAGEAFICAGVESMTRIPMGGYNPLPSPKLFEARPEVYISMGITAENVAKQYGISRAQQEEFAVKSQQKAAAAILAGKLKDEIIPLGPVAVDGCPRPETNLQGLAGLQPAFNQSGTVTAGTSSPLTDGAAAVLVTSESFARTHKLPMLARIKAVAVAGCKPEVMGLGPIVATQKVLERAGMTLEQIDIIELNEAFASQSIACIQDLNIPENKLNLDGGAIALGHPLGATGARITGKAAALLKREGKKYALATQCIGGGQGIATILEAV